MMSETNRLEYKLALTDGLEKEVVAFLNYRYGGVIYIGIDKASHVIGVENPDKIQLQIKDRLRNNILPSSMGLFEGMTKEDFFFRPFFAKK